MAADARLRLKNLILLLQPYELWFSELVNDCPTYRLEEKKWTVKNVETIIFGRGLLLRLLFLTTVLARSDVLIKKKVFAIETPSLLVCVPG